MRIIFEGVVEGGGHEGSEEERLKQVDRPGEWSAIRATKLVVTVAIRCSKWFGMRQWQPGTALATPALASIRRRALTTVTSSQTAPRN